MGLFEGGQRNQKTRDEIGFGSSSFPKVIIKKENIIIEERSTVVEHSSITGAAIYGHPEFGIYGTATYGSGSGGTFILGHPSFGVLGTSTLGSGSTTAVFSVTNPNNTFIERFDFDYFKDASTTANWDTTNFYLEISGGSEVVSNVIYMENKLITNARFDWNVIEGYSFLATVYLSADDGEHWEEVTVGELHTFANPGYKLKFKIMG